MRKLLAGKEGSLEPRRPGRDVEISPSRAVELISPAGLGGPYGYLVPRVLGLNPRPPVRLKREWG